MALSKNIDTAFQKLEYCLFEREHSGRYGAPINDKKWYDHDVQLSNDFYVSTSHGGGVPIKLSGIQH